MVELGTALLGIGAFALVGLIYWIDYKKSINSPTKIDPVSKGIMLSFLIIGTLFLAEGIGYFDEGWNQEHFWIHILIVVLLVSIFLIVARRKNPLPYKKQKDIVKGYIQSEYFAGEYVGDANINWLKVYKTTIENYSEDAIAGNFYVEVKSEDVMKIWCQINVFTGQLLHLQENPPLLLENDLLGKKTPYRDGLADQFDDNKPENAEQPTRE